MELINFCLQQLLLNARVEAVKTSLFKFPGILDFS